MVVIFLGILSVVLGLVVGSYANVWALRGLGQESVLDPSHCRSCNHRLHTKNLIPIISYIRQGGKCEYCGESISIQYPIVEGINAALWLISYLRYGISAHTIFADLGCTIMLVTLVTVVKNRIFLKNCAVWLLILGLLNLAISDTDPSTFALTIVVALCVISVALQLIKDKNAPDKGIILFITASCGFLGAGSAVIAFVISAAITMAINRIIKSEFQSHKSISLGVLWCISSIILILIGEIIDINTIFYWTTNWYKFITI